MRKIILDLESVSDVNLKERGLEVYANSPNTRISVLSFFDSKTKKLYTIHDEMLAQMRNNLSEEDREEIADIFHDEENLIVIAHNANFEKTMLTEKLNDLLFDLDILDVASVLPERYKYFCTQTWSNISGKPASLEKAAKAFDLDIKKDMKGSALMKDICMPMEETCEEGKVKGSPYVRVELNGIPFKGGQEVYERMRAYCEQDVMATLKLFNVINSKENIANFGDFKDIIKKGAKLTDYMNDKGVRVNIDIMKKLTETADIVFDKADEIAVKYFGVESASKREQVKAAIKEKTGIEVNRTGKKDLKKVILNNNLPSDVVEGLNQLAKYNVVSLKKAQKAIDSHWKERLYGLFKYCGAKTTGRWTSFGFQLQNLPRSTTDDYKGAMEFIQKNYNNKEEVLKNPALFTDGIRGCIEPDSEDDTFWIGDLSGIEARHALYISGYENIVEKMHNEGLDVYMKMAKAMYGEDADKEKRQVGKAGHLGGQFGQGKRSFQDFALGYGVELDLEQSQRVIMAFRKLYPNFTTEWRFHDNIVKKACFHKKSLRITLATGRVLDYGIPKIIEKKCAYTGAMTKNVHYFNGDKWVAMYGSKLFQNKVQSEARDIILMKMVDMWEMGYDIRMTIHDEVVIQVPKDADKAKIDADWDKAGAEMIEKYFPKLLIASDSCMIPRYWSH